jgi:ribonuclease E
LLNRDDDFIQRVLRDMYSNDVNRIVVDSSEGVKRVKKQLLYWSGGRTPEGVLIDEHREYQPILEFFRVNAAIKEALNPRVDLPSGGYVIIEPTEALTVIDVNSGSFTRSATSRETVLWTNCEAATEIARQLRLRNIGGVIVIDFIDMDSRRDQLKLLEHFDRVLKTDKARPQVAQLSELGLLELTRKRQGKNLYELFGETCPHCSGLGHLVKLPGIASSLSLTNYNPPVVVKSIDKPILEEKPVSSDEYTIDDDHAELELLHHPSYQEQTGRRRGSRRRRIEIGSRDEGVLTTSPEAEISDTPKPERKERSLLSRSSRRDETKLEKVLVEMSEEEQDIYALMGVSPLIRLDQEFKDPKSVIVLIKPVGDGDQETESQSELSNLESDADEPNGLLFESESDIESESGLGSETSQDIEPEDEMDLDNENDRPLIRRRRRRSSALQA